MELDIYIVLVTDRAKGYMSRPFSFALRSEISIGTAFVCGRRVTFMSSLNAKTETRTFRTIRLICVLTCLVVCLIDYFFGNFGEL